MAEQSEDKPPSIDPKVLSLPQSVTEGYIYKEQVEVAFDSHTIDDIMADNRGIMGDIQPNELAEELGKRGIDFKPLLDKYLSDDENSVDDKLPRRSDF